MKNLALTDDEINKISKIARERKFKLSTENVLYPTNMQFKGDTFLKSYDFLSILVSHLNTHMEIRDKIKEFLLQFESLYMELCKLAPGVTSWFGRKQIEKRFSNIVLNNISDINLLINGAFPVGRTVEIYDPDDAAGII